MSSEKTFTSYTASQSTQYAQTRPSYHQTLYSTLLSHHTSTGGKLTALLDIGCGPGTAARALAPHFKHVIGLDPSAAMIDTAKSNPNHPSTIRFEISSAETLGAELTPPVGGGSIDLLVAATAAHWFDMARFWARAARVLKPGGTVALWSVGKTKMHVDMPNAGAIQAAVDEINRRELESYMERGNLVAENLYVGLALPWTLENPVVEFEEGSFVRREWGAEDSEEFFEGGGMSMDLETFGKVMGTMSPVQRWRDEHPERVGTASDVVEMMKAEIVRLSHEAGVEPGEELVIGSLTGVLLMVKKKMS